MFEGLLGQNGFWGGMSDQQKVSSQNYYKQAMQNNYDYQSHMNHMATAEVERLDKLAKHKELEIELIRTDEGTRNLYDEMIEAQNKYKTWVALKL